MPDAAPGSAPPASAPPPSDRGTPSSRRATSAPKLPVKRRTVGRIGLRLTIGLVVTAGLPLIIGVLLAVFLARRAADLFYNPEVTSSIERSLAVYRPLVRALKADMRHRADAIAASEPLRAAAALQNQGEVELELKKAFEEYDDKVGDDPDDLPLVELASLQVYVDLTIDDCLERFVPADPDKAADVKAQQNGEPGKDLQRIGRVDSGKAVDLTKNYALVQCKPLGPDETKAPMLVATFLTDRARIDQQKESDKFLEAYKGVEQRRDEWVRLNVAFYAALLAVTIVFAAAVGYAFSRSVSRRVLRVADAAGRVAAGDLAVRVPEEGKDEIGDLAVSFNRMLGDLERSRARIEYLQRIGAWQDMARRLAHEIKNPLTPIQLAVEECHHQYHGDDAHMRKLLDTTLEIVTEEVGTLRRLVTEFSDFARLPHARLEEADLATLLADARPALERLGRGTEEADLLRLTPSGGHPIPVRVTVKVAIVRAGASVGGVGSVGRGSAGSEGVATTEPMVVAVDKQMLRKSLDNLVRNAVQAIRAAGRGFRVVVQATELDAGRVAIDVEDDGPGVPEQVRPRVFDPYFTTRTEGTGLGLAIVKKIVIEHGGTITCDVAGLGGARFRIILPSSDSAEARAALEASAKEAAT